MLNSNNPKIGYNLTKGGDHPNFSQSVIDIMRQKSSELWNSNDFIIKSLKGQSNLIISDLSDIFELKTNGVLIKDIAEIYQLDRHTISHILRGKSWKDILPFDPTTNNYAKIYNENIVYKIRELVQSGKNYKEISVELSIPENSIRKMAKGYGNYSKYTKIEPIKENLLFIKDNIITQIRDDFMTNSYNYKTLSEKYNISSPIIGQIIRAEKRYSHLESLVIATKRAKFTLFEANIIREEHKNISIVDLSKKYNVNYTTISNIINNITYTK